MTDNSQFISFVSVISQRIVILVPKPDVIFWPNADIFHNNSFVVDANFGILGHAYKITNDHVLSETQQMCVLYLA